MVNGKIGILCSEHHGDIALCTSVLKYKDKLWPNKDVVWFCGLAPERATFLDMLKYNDAILEIREWPNVFFKEIMDENAQLRYDKKNDFEQLKDIEIGYFPAPWAALPNNALNAVNYANIPRMIYGADPSLEWHPYLGFSNDEREQAKDFCAALPHSKTVMLETQLKSAGDFRVDEDSIKNIMQLCRNKWGKCNFIFASKLDYSHLFDDPGVVSCSHFTVRQCALIHNHCDLFIGVCSGISVTSSCWGNKPVPRVEMGGSMVDYTLIANGPVVSVICDNWSKEQMKIGFERGVQEALNKF